MQAARNDETPREKRKDFSGIERQSYSVPEIAWRNNTSALTIWRAIASGALEARKIGRRTIVLAEAERAWIESLPSARGRA